jgi:hypothetical protein
VLVELKVVPVRDQVGIPTVWAAFDETGRPRNTALDGSVEAMVTELLWWVTALIAAREHDQEAVVAGA